MFRICFRRNAGQSLPLLALMMVVLAGSVGLSVDVGNAYGQQRRMQNAANAGALAGMSALLAEQTYPGTWTNGEVWHNVKRSLAGNRVEIDQNQYTFEAHYIQIGNPTPIFLGRWDGTTDTVAAGNPPSDVDRIRVKVTNRVETFFARIVKQNTLTVNGVGDACYGNNALGIMPIGIPFQLKRFHTQNGGGNSGNGGGNSGNGGGNSGNGGGNSGNGGGGNTSPSPSPSASPSPSPAPTPFDRVFNGWTDNPASGPDSYDVLGSELSPNDAAWGNWGAPGTTSPMKNKVIYIRIENESPGTPGSHIGWLDWTKTGNPQNELGKALTMPGTLQNGFVNAKNPVDTTPNIGDWLNGFTGVKGGDADALANLLNWEILLPIYSTSEGNGGNVAYEWVRTGKFRIIGYELKSLQSGGKENRGVPPPSQSPDNKYLMVEYLGDASDGGAMNCMGITQ